MHFLSITYFFCNPKEKWYNLVFKCVKQTRRCCVFSPLCSKYGRRETSKDILLLNIDLSCVHHSHRLLHQTVFTTTRKWMSNTIKSSPYRNCWLFVLLAVLYQNINGTNLRLAILAFLVKLFSRLNKLLWFVS